MWSPSLAAYMFAAIEEIAGCFAFWAWFRLAWSILWLIPVSERLVMFVALLTRLGFAGRAYAAYGGVYFAASLGWLWMIEGQAPTRWDFAGASLGLVGATVILLGREHPAVEFLLWHSFPAVTPAGTLRSLSFLI